MTGEHVDKSDDEWREALTPEQFDVLRKKATERAFTGDYWATKQAGSYCCAGCGPSRRACTPRPW